MLKSSATDCLSKTKQDKNLLPLVVVEMPSVLTQRTTTNSWFSFLLCQLISYCRLQQQIYNVFTAFGVGHQHHIISSGFQVLQSLERFHTAHCGRIRGPSIGEQQLLQGEPFRLCQRFIYLISKVVSILSHVYHLWGMKLLV